MFDEPIGLGAAPAASSNSWLEQQQLAEVPASGMKEGSEPTEAELAAFLADEEF